MTPRPFTPRLVPKPAEPDPSTAYEHEERRRIAARNWKAVHIAGDRAPPLCLGEKRRGNWRA
jgi:hypothetical protein